MPTKINNPEFGLIVKPAMSYAFFGVLHWLLLSVLFTAMAWILLPAFMLIGLLLMSLAFYRFLQTRNVAYHLTAEVLQIHTGIFLKRIDNLELYRVRDYMVTQNLLMQFFNLMDLILVTTDPSDPVVILHGIPFSDLPDTIRTLVQKARQHLTVMELS